jgi:hypothetical protein
MMSQRSKRELTEAIRPRYLKANKTKKEQILNEYVAATGYHRKYAIRLLGHGPKLPSIVASSLPALKLTGVSRRPNPAHCSSKPSRCAPGQNGTILVQASWRWIW